MPGKSFDSNVLLYLVSQDDEKSTIAEKLLVEGGTISVQVLNEMASVGHCKFKMPWAKLSGFIDDTADLLTVVPIERRTHELARMVAERYRLAFYDAAIVAAALLADCDTLWSEDMHDGLVIDGRLTIRNPFAA